MAFKRSREAQRSATLRGRFTAIPGNLDVHPPSAGNIFPPTYQPVKSIVYSSPRDVIKEAVNVAFKLHEHRNEPLPPIFSNIEVESLKQSMSFWFDKTLIESG